MQKFAVFKKYICIFETSLKMLIAGLSNPNLEIYKKLKTVEFFNIEILKVAFAIKPIFAFQFLNRSVHGRLTPICV